MAKNPVNGKILPEWALIALTDEGKRTLEVCYSANGYYIGSMCNDGVPNFRTSREHWNRREWAEKALNNDDWTVRENP